MSTNGKNYGRKHYMGGGVLCKETKRRIIRSVEKTFRQLGKQLIKESLNDVATRNSVSLQ